MYRVIALALAVSIPVLGFAADPQKPVQAKPALYADVHPTDLGKRPHTIATTKIGGIHLASHQASPFIGIQPKFDEDRTRFMDYGDIMKSGGQPQAF